MMTSDSPLWFKFYPPSANPIHPGEAPADPDISPSGASVALNLQRGELVILGTQYAGEMKKGVFTFMNYLLPKQVSLSSGMYWPGWQSYYAVYPHAAWWKYFQRLLVKLCWGFCNAYVAFIMHTTSDCMHDHPHKSGNPVAALWMQHRRAGWRLSVLWPLGHRQDNAVHRSPPASHWGRRAWLGWQWGVQHWGWMLCQMHSLTGIHAEILCHCELWVMLCDYVLIYIAPGTMQDIYGELRGQHNVVGVQRTWDLQCHPLRDRLGEHCVWPWLYGGGFW